MRGYDMSDDRITRAAARLVAAWALAVALAFAAVGCKSKPKPTVDEDHWDNQGEVIP
jgi:hypothetical protein